MKFTDCECEQAGWCQRHQCEKDAYFFEMCRLSKDVFDKGEAGNLPIQKRRTQKPRDVSQPCVHRGNELRTTECESCNGRVLLKVFACEVHGECTVQRRVGETAVCLNCHEYQPSTMEL